MFHRLGVLSHSWGLNWIRISDYGELDGLEVFSIPGSMIVANVVCHFQTLNWQGTRRIGQDAVAQETCFYPNRWECFARSTVLVFQKSFRLGGDRRKLVHIVGVPFRVPVNISQRPDWQATWSLRCPNWPWQSCLCRNLSCHLEVIYDLTVRCQFTPWRARTKVHGQMCALKAVLASSWWGKGIFTGKCFRRFHSYSTLSETMVKVWEYWLDRISKTPIISAVLQEATSLVFRLIVFVAALRATVGTTFRRFSSCYSYKQSAY